MFHDYTIIDFDIYCYQDLSTRKNYIHRADSFTTWIDSNTQQSFIR